MYRLIFPHTDREEVHAEIPSQLWKLAEEICEPAAIMSDSTGLQVAFYIPAIETSDGRYIDEQWHWIH
jgi:hypothetical protein